MGMHSTYTATHYKDLNIDWQARAVTRHGEDISLTPKDVVYKPAACRVYTPWQVVIFAKETLCFAGGRFCVGQSAGFGRDGGVRKRFGVCRRTV